MQSARISFNVTNSTTTAFQIYELLKPFIEGEVNWTRASTGLNWAVPGASGATDRGSTVLGTVSPTPTGPITITLNSAGIALVQSWIDNPGTNRGLIIQNYTTATDGIDLDSSEATTIANRPKLTITYSEGTGNQPPRANDDAYTIAEAGTIVADDDDGSATPGTTADDGVLANDTDAEDEPLTAQLLTNPNHGTLVFNSDGTFTYTHDGGETISDSFTYRVSTPTSTGNIATVSITVTPVNDPPQSANDAFSVSEGGSLTTTDATGLSTVDIADDNGVLANDTDAKGSSMTAVLVSGPSHGSLTLNANGTFIYTHDGSATTSDSFTYRANDGTTQGNVATVTFTITPAGSSQTKSFQDGTDGYTGTRNARIFATNPTTNYGNTNKLQANSSPGLASLLFWNVSAIPQGSTVQSAAITINVTNPSVRSYEIYEVLKPWVESEVTWNRASAGQNWEVAGASGATDRGSTVLGTLQVGTNGLATITLNSAGVALVQTWINNPSANRGLIIQDYVVAPDGIDFDSSEATTVANRPRLTVTYTADPGGNQPPQSNGDAYTVVQGGTLTANDATGSLTPGNANDNGVLVNDTDADGDPLTAILVSGPTHGLLTLNTDGTFSYTHDGSATTSDSFTYRANDGTEDGNVATVNITITSSSTQTATFQDGAGGYTGTRDTRLYANSPTANAGSNPKLQVNSSPGLTTLLLWDVSSIPAGSTVESVSFTINVTNSSVRTYEIYEVLKPWVESEATWNRAAAGLDWEVPGAAGATDRGSTVLGTVQVGANGLATVTLNSAGVAVVQSWIDNPGTNRGLVIQNYSVGPDGLDFDSSEATTIANRPKLSITYAPGGG